MIPNPRRSNRTSWTRINSGNGEYKGNEALFDKFTFFQAASHSSSISRLGELSRYLIGSTRWVVCAALGWHLWIGSTAFADNVTILFPVELTEQGNAIPGITDATGGSLNGYLIRLGTFGNSASTVASNLIGFTTKSEILQKLEDQFTPYTSFNFSEDFLTAGTGFYPQDPENNPQPSMGASLLGKPIDMILSNGDSSQIMIVRMKNSKFFDNANGSVGVFSTRGDLSGNRVTEFQWAPDKVDLLMGFYDRVANIFQTAVVAGGASQITSPLSQTNTSGSAFSYQITANNGADRFFATTNTNSSNPLTSTNLPSWASINTNTGLINFTTNSVSGSYAIRLVASNSLTTSVATNTLSLVLQSSSLTFTTTTNEVSCTAGVQIPSFTFVSTGVSPTYNTSDNLHGLTISTNGVLSGTPITPGTNSVTVQATSGGQSGTTTFTLAVAEPTISVPSGSLTGGQIVTVAGTARTIPLAITPGFTSLSGSVTTPYDGVSFDGNNLVVSAGALPLPRGTTSFPLTLRAARSVGASTVTATTSVPLRIVAPTPTRIVGATSFEVDVGEPFSTTILTDAGSYASLVSLNNAPPTLSYFSSGVVSGTDNSTTLPFEYLATVVFDSQGLYEGGGIFTANVIFRLRNLNAPLITSRNRCIGGINRTLTYAIEADNNPSRYEIIGTLPPGLKVTDSGRSIQGKPTAAGNYPLVLKAYNSRRPGSTDPLDEQLGSGDLRLVISDSGPAVSTPVASINNMTVGMVHNKTPFITTDGGMRLFAIGLPTGLFLDEHDGTLSGTNTASGTFNVTIYLMNGSGWTIKQMTLKVK